MNTFKCFISAQCVGYWLQKHRNTHRITPKQCPLWQHLRREAGAAGKCNLSSPEAALQKQPRTGSLPFCSPGSGHRKHPSTSLLTHAEFQVYNMNLLPILKGFLWLKEIYNQHDNPQDSMNLWRQNYRVRARKHLLELPQILIFFLNNFAQQ